MTAYFEKTAVKTISWLERTFDVPDNQVQSSNIAKNDQVINKMLKFIPEGSFGIDVGAGDGIFAKACNKRGLNVVSTEPYMPINRSLSPDAVKSSGNSLPFSDNTFEFSTMLFMLHHCHESHEIIREAARVTKPGGFVVIKDETLRHPLMYPLAKANEIVSNNRATPNHESVVDQFVGFLKYLTLVEFNSVFNELELDLVYYKAIPLRKKIDLLYKTQKHLFILRK